jgi:hypothetical protein
MASRRSGYQNVTVGPFEGLNLDKNPLAVGKNELRVAEEIARRDSWVGTRPAAAKLGSGEDYENQITVGGTGRAIQGAVEYRKDFDEGRRLIVVAHNSTVTRKIWYDDGNQLPAISAGTITTNADYIWSFGIHNNLLWGTGGPAGRSQVNTESIWTWDGNIGTGAQEAALTNKSDGARLRPKFVRAWRNYVMVNGLQTTGASNSFSNNPMVTRFATFSEDPTDNAKWLDGNTIGFAATGSSIFERAGLDSYGGAYSTGFGDYQDNEGDFLLLLSNVGITSVSLDPVNDFRVTDTIPNGCVHERAFVNLGLDSGDAVYVSESGVHSLRQSQMFGGKADTYLSWKIRDFWKTLNRARLPFTCGAYDRENGRVVFAFTVGADTAHTVLYCLDVKGVANELNSQNARWYGPWRIRADATGSTYKMVNHLAYLRDASDNWWLYVFTTDGNVLRFDNDAYMDLNANGYAPVMQTRDFVFGDLVAEKRVGDAIITTGGATSDYSISISTVFDFGRRKNTTGLQMKGSGQTLVDALVGSKVSTSFATGSDKVYLTGRGRAIGLEFSHGSRNQPFYIGAASLRVAGAGEDIGDPS